MSKDGRRSEFAKVEHRADTHAGLWLDKGLRVLEPTDERDKNAIRELIEKVCGTLIPDGYSAALSDREALLRGLHGGTEGGVTRCWSARAEGRMIVGLGAQSLRETNISLLHTWGVPQIPGSALKGLAAATAHRRGSASWKKASEKEGTAAGVDHRALFGTTDGAGCVVFHDAWWMPGGAEKKVPLDLDVMTVHHASYYGKGKDFPADWDEPNPVSFVTATGSYLVALSGPPAWVEIAAEWLAVGLKEEGIGAKTFAGYGRMSLEPLRSEKEKRDHKALDSLRNLPAQHAGNSNASTSVQRLLEAARDGVDPAGVRQAAQALFEKDPSFWKSWRSDPRRTTEERAMMAFAVPEAAAPVVAQPAVPASASLAWVAAEAWRATVKGRVVVIARLSGKELDPREFRLLLTGNADVDALLESALGNTSSQSPAAVEVQVKGKGKLDAVRPKQL